jgi:hypothetical protein
MFITLKNLLVLIPVVTLVLVELWHQVIPLLTCAARTVPNSIKTTKFISLDTYYHI